MYNKNISFVIYYFYLRELIMAAKKDSKKSVPKSEEDKGITLKDAVQIKRLRTTVKKVKK